MMNGRTGLLREGILQPEQCLASHRANGVDVTLIDLHSAAISGSKLEAANSGILLICAGAMNSEFVRNRAPGAR